MAFVRASPLPSFRMQSRFRAPRRAGNSTTNRSHSNAQYWPAAQQAVPADRFAREIVAILKSSHAARSRRLNGRPVGRSHRARTRLKSIITVSFARIAATIYGILLAHLFSFVAERAIALAHNCRRISETAL